MDTNSSGYAIAIKVNSLFSLKPEGSATIPNHVDDFVGIKESNQYSLFQIS